MDTRAKAQLLSIAARAVESAEADAKDALDLYEMALLANAPSKQKLRLNYEMKEAIVQMSIEKMLQIKRNLGL